MLNTVKVGDTRKAVSDFFAPFFRLSTLLYARGIKIKNIYWELFYENTKNDQTAVNGKLNYKLRIIHYKKPPARANGTKPHCGFGIVSYTFFTKRNENFFRRIHL